ncbi:NAD-glutamate dehydrogenase [Fodinicola acaciae]|uniref:NAD-glutamate dehydrogenase n=1 Tax=Fodinicola acaciae TaxID=2681555 RepID=UPI0013CF685F|nr:NAD-glutamate dehydrogenase [Fodinicola acaciae]
MRTEAPLDDAGRDGNLEGVSDLVGAAAERAPDARTAALVRRYWGMVPADDLAGRAPEDLLTAVRSHRELAEQRVTGELRMRIHTPDPAKATWAGGHTLVEIVTDDMPFLVDSVTAALSRHNLTVHLVVHPQLVVRREVLGALSEVPADEGLAESWMHLEVDRTRNEAELTAIHNDLQEVLTDVREAVEDWPRMRDTALNLAAELDDGGGLLPVPAKDVEDSRELLRWLADDHFTFLGYREYELGEDGAGHPYLAAVPSTGLGILRQDQTQVRSLKSMPAAARDRIKEKRLLVITKANSRSTVHRSAYLDYIGIKVFGNDGEVIGERRFLGLFSSAAYLESVKKLPVVRRKVADILTRSGLSKNSHSGKDLISILETYPRDEFFQAPTDEIYDTSMGVLRMAGRRVLRLFVRRDSYGRFISCLVYMPRDRYTTKNRVRMQEILTEALNGVGLDYTTRVTEDLMARVHFTVRTDPTDPPDHIDVAALQERLVAATRSWDDDFAAAMQESVGEEQARVLVRRYGPAFPEAYKEEHTVLEAAEDVSRLEMLEEPGDLGTHLYRKNDELRFTVRRLLEPMSLSDVLPVLQSMGVKVFDERPFRFHRLDANGDNRPEDTAWVYDFGLGECIGVDADAVRGPVQNAFSACWRGESEVDGLNALVLGAGLTWQQVSVLRAYAKYRRQVGQVYSDRLVSTTLAQNPGIAGGLVDLFLLRFDPGLKLPMDERNTRAEELVAKLTAELDSVESLDADRIMRSLLATILATTRTNYFQRGRDGRPKPYLALKIDPSMVPDLPAPRPKYEIFVYSPRFEGVHLRFGPIARGGLRWSDRRDDFRTEVLGLVKAQMVKNSVIVPVGAKGGFVLKRPPASTDREAFLAEGQACYRMFISGLLDLTDNRNANTDGTTEVIPATDVVRHDDDDSYLVVAADKGTATFSDLANSIAKEYGFWLGDAFASGGSQGYDHKKMGITSRGAWESVKRHFRELGHDTQTEDFTAVGIGDMSGDVFGNGMLLSEHIRLVAAFDHRHIFVDPKPVAATSYAERRRLFDLPRSSWADYDTSLISAGGGVFPRTAKSIPISAEMATALGISDPTVTKLAPAELIRQILMAPVDLLWNGGIGTYVKASTETHADVGDKTNDGVRVNGRDLRCKVVGEGGNLGFTQRGRIEYALAGGRINTDAIDNSAGVDTSDREVNIKILLDGAISSGQLAEQERNSLLAQMTDELAHLVLQDNYEQNIALGNARSGAGPMVTVHERQLRALEAEGRLDRALEFLPSVEEMREREAAGRGLTSPELSVLLAYVKIGLEQDIAASDLPDEDWCMPTLVDYFPTPLRENFAELMKSHPLRRDIITTRVVNDCVDRGGTSFVFRAVEETGADVVDVVRAAEVVRQVFGLREVWAEAEKLDVHVPTAAQTQLYLRSRRLVDRATRWLLQSRRPPIDVSAEVARFRPAVAELLPKVEQMRGPREREAIEAEVAQLCAEGVPTEVSRQAVRLIYAFGLLDVVEVANRSGQPPTEVAEVYFAVAERFEMEALLDRISDLKRDDRWKSLARMALRYDLYAAMAEFTAEVIQSTPDNLGPHERVKEWIAANRPSLARVQASLRDIDELGSDLATLSVLLRQIRTVIRASASG